MSDSRTEWFGFLLVDQFSLIAFSSAVEPLRIANRLLGRRAFDWVVASQAGGTAQASNSLSVNVDHSFKEIADVQLEKVFVCSGLEVHRKDHGDLIGALRKLERSGADIGAVCTGTHILAMAGLLDGYQCTIHWENLPAFEENFPDIEISTEIFEIDRKRYTCSGGTAAIDMMLNIIATSQGPELAALVADQFIHERIRDDRDQQRTNLPARLGVRHPKLLKVVSLMEENLEEPLSRGELADAAHLSTRQLERLFRRYLTRSPARFYLELRLNRARLLLLQTNMSIIDVALACGFVSASHFSKCYRDFFGKTPRKERSLPEGIGDGTRLEDGLPSPEVAI